MRKIHTPKEALTAMMTFADDAVTFTTVQTLLGFYVGPAGLTPGIGDVGRCMLVTKAEFELYMQQLIAQGATVRARNTYSSLGRTDKAYIITGVTNLIPFVLEESVCT